MHDNHIKIILVEPSHPGNIGSVARAMKNMGLANLVLVNPKRFPSEQASSRAANAKDILEKAVVVEDLSTALAASQIVYGVTSRQSEIPLVVQTPKEAAKDMTEDLQKNEIAICFGREQYGFKQAEIDKFHRQITIPANPAYPVLNLAQALQIIAYEIFQAKLALDNKHGKENSQTLKYPLADQQRLEKFYELIAESLPVLKRYAPEDQERLMSYLTRFFNRAKPNTNEINLLFGLFKGIKKP